MYHKLLLVSYDSNMIMFIMIIIINQVDIHNPSHYDLYNMYWNSIQLFIYSSNIIMIR